MTQQPAGISGTGPRPTSPICPGGRRSSPAPTPGWACRPPGPGRARRPGGPRLPEPGQGRPRRRPDHRGVAGAPAYRSSAWTWRRSPACAAPPRRSATASRRVDLLINNAGVMDVPYQRTEDGFELTLATNHLGPFALTGLLLDRLAAGRADRDREQHRSPAAASSTSTTCSRSAAMTAERAYSQSKLANLLFTYELDRRCGPRARAWPRLPAIPGSCTRTCSRTSSRAEQFLLSPAMRIINFWAVQDARMGALPELRAATDPSASRRPVLRPAPARPAAPVLHRLPGGRGVERPVPRRGRPGPALADRRRS